MRDILKTKCGWHKAFPYPTSVSTVKDYILSGKQADIVLISLVRTEDSDSPFIYDTQQLSLMLSRARCGLYIFGNKNAANKSDVFKQFLKKLDKRVGPLEVTVKGRGKKGGDTSQKVKGSEDMYGLVKAEFDKLEEGEEMKD
jgi:hypothetical protein